MENNNSTPAGGHSILKYAIYGTGGLVIGALAAFGYSALKSSSIMAQMASTGGPKNDTGQGSMNWGDFWSNTKPADKGQANWGK